METTEDRKKYQFINPFTDMGFKKIFGQDITKDLLIDFLNDLLIGERKITDIQFLDKEQLGVTEDDRSLIYDVYCETVTGEKIIVECRTSHNLFSRIVPYITFQTQLHDRERKEQYGNMK